MKILKIIGRQILDSRGNPTVEADVILEDGTLGRAAVPSGASTGSNEAVELRDNDKSKFMGKSVFKAVGNINGEISQNLNGQDVAKQEELDQKLIDLDGTENKGRLGANAILAVSMAAAKAASITNKKHLYEYLKTLTSIKEEMSLPLPMMNIINGGKHAHGSSDIQEFMIIPQGASSFSEALRIGVEVFHNLALVLKNNGYQTLVGDEGGYAPSLKKGNKEALDLIDAAIKKSGYKIGSEVSLGMDVASTELYDENKYLLKTENKSLTTDEMINWLKSLCANYPLISLEDGLSENDWYGWKKLTTEIGSSLQLVGDDLLVTNTKFLKRAIEEKAANAILIKVNQIGTLTETIKAVEMAKAAGWNAIISHRSGETEDTFISHLAVALSAGQIKTGSLSRTDRVAKYNELLRIEETLENPTLAKPFTK